MKSWADDGASSDEGEDTGREESNSGANRISIPSNPNIEKRNEEEGKPSSQKKYDVPLNGPFIAFVGNLPFSVDQNTIGNHFDNGGCAVLDVIINMDQDNRPRGFAHVEFKDRESLILAMSASGSSIGGREIKVDFNVGKSKNDRGGRMGGGDRGSDRDRGDRGGGREETELSWNRAPKRDAAPLSTKDSKNERNDREDRRGEGRKSDDRRSDERRSDRGSDSRASQNRGPELPLPLPPATRPKILIAPRTILVEGGDHPIAKVSDIFGGGKAHDENKYEEERKKKAAQDKIEHDALDTIDKERKGQEEQLRKELTDATAHIALKAAPNSKEAVDTVVVESGLSDITVKLEDNLVVTAVGSEDAVLKGVEVVARGEKVVGKTLGVKGRGGRGEGRGGRGEGRGRVDGRERGEGRGDSKDGRGRGREEGRGRGRGRGDKESAGRVASTTRPVIPGAVLATSTTAPTPSRVQTAMPDMMTIGRGGGRGRGKIFAKEGADNNSGVGAGPVPVLKAKVAPVVEQRNAFSGLGDDSDSD